MAAVKKEDAILGWHWLRDNGMLQHVGNVRVEAGKTYSAKGPLELCANGMHASIRALDGLQYAPGCTISRVRLYGAIVTGPDKLCARHREVLWMADATRTLHEFAVWCAEQALLAERAAGREPAEACWRAVECKRRWLDGKATDHELDAAWAAARDAARAAAGDAARDAAWAAAWAAARDAARAAAGDAAREKQAAKLDEMLLALAPLSAAG